MATQFSIASTPSSGCNGEGVDIYILDTGKEVCFEYMLLNIIPYIGMNYDHCEFDCNRAVYPGYDQLTTYMGLTKLVRIVVDMELM